MTKTSHPKIGLQPLPQFDGAAKLIVAPAITTARGKRVAKKMATTTDLPYTINPHTKLAELQILKKKRNQYGR